MKSALVAVLLVGCTALPAPVEPAPAPFEPPPVVEPTAPPCARACAHRAELRCPPTYSACVDTCEAYEAEAREQRAPAIGWSPICMTNAATCAAADACRGSGQP